MNNSNKFYDDLIIQYLTNQLDENDEKLLKEWLESSKANMIYFMKIKDIWDISSLKQKAADEEHEWAKFRKKFIAKKGKKKILVPLSTVLKIAAIIVICLGLSLAIFLSKNNYSYLSETGYFETTVPKGFKSHLKLPDGTKIIINSESKLIYPVRFSKDKREITFEGEAYFDVVKNTRKPFIINSPGMTTTVLGTTFNLKTYPNEEFTSTLISGKIKFESTNLAKGIYLYPEQRLQFNQNSGKYTIDNDVDTLLYIAWKNNQFMFRNEPLEKLAKRLERWYDVKIYLESPELKDFKYTGNFRNEETIWQVLDIIKLTTPIEYRTKYREVFITKNKE